MLERLPVCSSRHLNPEEDLSEERPIAVTDVTIKIESDGVAEYFDVKLPRLRGLLTGCAPIRRLMLDRFGITFTRSTRTRDGVNTNILKTMEADKELKVALHLAAEVDHGASTVSVNGWCDEPEMIDSTTWHRVKNDRKIVAKLVSVNIDNVE